ncbi:hypothetical protein JCM6882_006884 [Rhodosporidiobolus microsporus]
MASPQPTTEATGSEANQLATTSASPSPDEPTATASPAVSAADPPPPTDEADERPEGGSGSLAEEAEETEKEDSWQAVFSPEANAWYFWNAETQETTWTNPRALAEEPAAQPEAGPSSAATSSKDVVPESGLPGIDPDLAWLDPSAAVRGGKGAGGLTQTARFNARTGRFQGDPALNPDRISDFQRGHRQQEAYFDVEGWETSLNGQGLKRKVEASDDSAKKRPTTKQVDQFRRAKEDKKRKKLARWLGS